MKKESIFAGLVGFAAGYIAGKDATKKESEPSVKKNDSLAAEIIEEVEREQERLEKQSKPIIYKKNKTQKK